MPLEMDNERIPRETPFKFILSHEALKWAWYSLLIITLIFVIFRAKRTQRIIPVLKKPENASIEFTKSIGTLYYQQKNHKKLALLKMKLFLEYIRNHYFISTHEVDVALINKITLKSQVDPEVVDSIFKIYQRVEEVESVSDNLLSSLHEKIQYFYQHCK